MAWDPPSTTMTETGGGGAQIANLGRRIGAAVIDLLVTSALFVLFAGLFGELQTSDGNARAEVRDGAAFGLAGAIGLYYFLLETVFGATLGKKALGLRVVREDGTRAGAGAVAVRTLLRIVDGLPVLYLVGLITAAATPRTQRVGDLAGKTLVVRNP